MTKRIALAVATALAALSFAAPAGASTPLTITIGCERLAHHDRAVVRTHGHAGTAYTVDIVAAGNDNHVDHDIAAGSRFHRWTMPTHAGQVVEAALVHVDGPSGQLVVDQYVEGVACR